MWKNRIQASCLLCCLSSTLGMQSKNRLLSTKVWSRRHDFSYHYWPGLDLVLILAFGRQNAQK